MNGLALKYKDMLSYPTTVIITKTIDKNKYAIKFFAMLENKQI